MNMKAMVAAACLVLLCSAAICLLSSQEANGETVYVADVDGTSYSTLEEAIGAASDGSTVTLKDDIVLIPKDGTANKLIVQISIGHNITLDLNGKTISYDLDRVSGSVAGTPCIFGIDGSKVTIKGDGTIDAELGDNNSYGINVSNNGELIIKNGTFKGALTAVQVGSGSLFIEDGTFVMAETCDEYCKANPAMYKYIVNAIDANWNGGTAKIKITGGSFCYDLSDNPEGPNSTYVEDGSSSILVDGLYRVAKKCDPSASSETIESTYDRIITDLGEKTEAVVKLPSAEISMNGDAAIGNVLISVTPESFSEAPDAVASYEITIVSGVSYTADITVAAEIPYGHVPLVYYIDDEGNLVPVEVVSYTSSTVTFRTTHTTPFVVMAESEPVITPDDEDDDDDLVPGQTVHVEKSKDNTTTVVACAAAAVAAAMIAAFLLIDGRKP